MSGLTELPSTSETSLGSDRKDLIPFKGEKHRASALLLNKLRAYAIQMGEMLGLGDGSTPGSLRAQVNALMEGGGGGGDGIYAGIDLASSLTEVQLTSADLGPVDIPEAPPFLGLTLQKNKVHRYDFSDTNPEQLTALLIPDGEEGDIICLAQNRGGAIPQAFFWYLLNLSGQQIEGSFGTSLASLIQSPMLLNNENAVDMRLTLVFRDTQWRVAKADAMRHPYYLGNAYGIRDMRVDIGEGPSDGQVLTVRDDGEGGFLIRTEEPSNVPRTQTTYETSGIILPTDAVSTLRATDGSITLTLPAVPASEFPPYQIDFVVQTSSLCTVTLEPPNEFTNINGVNADLVISDSIDVRLYRGVTGGLGWTIVEVGRYTP